MNALAPLSCVVDLFGFRAAAVALPAFRARPEGKPKLRALPKLLGYARLFCVSGGGYGYRVGLFFFVLIYGVGVFGGSVSVCMHFGVLVRDKG